MSPRPSHCSAAFFLGLGFGLAVVAGGCAAKPPARPETAPPKPTTAEQQIGFHLAMARAYLSQRQYGPALAHIRDAKQKGGRRADVLRLSGVILRDAKLYGDAEHDLKESLKLDKRDAGTWNALGVLLDLVDRPADADQALRWAIELAPKVATYHNDLGFSLYVRGKYLDAVTAFREALRILPTYRRARNNLGFAYGRLGHYGRAFREFQRANPEPQAYNNLALAYEMRGDHDRAIESYVEAIKRNPGLRIARTNLETLCQKLRRPLPPLPKNAARGSTNDRSSDEKRAGGNT
jgi:Flp pilus assembly protein TadD